MGDRRALPVGLFHVKHFAVLTHLETFAVIARLHKIRLDIPADGLLPMREDDKDTPAYQSWKSLQALIERARKAIKSAEGVGMVMIERLSAGAVTDWSREKDHPYHLFRIPLVTNPGCHEYAGGEVVHMPVGSLWWQDVEAHNSSANFGEAPRYHLAFELLKPGADDNDEGDL